VGMLADQIGIQAALTWMAFLPLVGAACAIPLPDVPGGTARPARAGA